MYLVVVVAAAATATTSTATTTSSAWAAGVYLVHTYMYVEQTTSHDKKKPLCIQHTQAKLGVLDTEGFSFNHGKLSVLHVLSKLPM